ncbi:hypothetical protein vseg_002454 [Gypsophila vaccaria]
MAETIEEQKLSLKIMVHKKAKKVVFAEASKEFVNFIISLMSLPLSSVTRVLLQSEKGTAGSLGNLYKSVESLDTSCFEKDIDKDSVFKPRATVSVPLLSLHEEPASACKVFQCIYCRKTSTVKAPSCCQVWQTEVGHTCNCSKEPNLEIVRGGAFYMVTDSLEVKPMSIELIKSHAMEFDELEAKHVQVGLQEVVLP